MAHVGNFTTGSPSLVNPLNAELLPVLCLLSTLVTIPAFRAFQLAGNFFYCNMIVINGFINISSAVNAILWPNENIDNWWEGYVWCDIQAALKYPLTLAIAMTLCLLAKQMADAVKGTPKQNSFWKNVCLVYTIPVLQAGLLFLIRDGRYDIVPVMGCADSIADYVWPALLIYQMWVPITGFLTFIYALKVYVRIVAHRRQVGAILSSSGSGFQDRTYVKMAWLAFLVMLVFIPFQCVFFINSMPASYGRFIWSEIHGPESHEITMKTLRDYGRYGFWFQYYGWASVAWNFLIFLFFGFIDESLNVLREFLVRCGFAKIWPSLRQPVASRHRIGSYGSSNGALAQQSRLSRFWARVPNWVKDPTGAFLNWLATAPSLDNVPNGRFYRFVVVFLDFTSKLDPSNWSFSYRRFRARKDSQVTTLGSGDHDIEMNVMPKNFSQSTLDTEPLTGVTTDASSSGSQSRSTSPLSASSSHTSGLNIDSIASAPSLNYQNVALLRYTQEQPTIQPGFAPSGAQSHVNPFSNFHNNTAFPPALFTRKPRTPPRVVGPLETVIQHRHRSYTPDLESQLSAQSTTVKTHISAGPAPCPLSAGQGVQVQTGLERRESDA